MHSGWSLKRVESGEGEKRHVLKDHRSGDLLALADPEAALVQMLDGRHDLPELIAEAEARCGDKGLERLARLLAERLSRDARRGRRPARGGDRAAARSARAHDDAAHRTLDWLPRLIAWVYGHGGYLLSSAAAARRLPRARRRAARAGVAPPRFFARCQRRDRGHRAADPRWGRGAIGCSATGSRRWAGGGDPGRVRGRDVAALHDRLSRLVPPTLVWTVLAAVLPDPRAAAHGERCCDRCGRAPPARHEAEARGASRSLR